MKRRRVKITGIGLVTPAGIGKDEFREGILSKQSFVGAVKRFPVDGGPFVAAEIKKFNVGDYYDTPSFKRLPRHTQFALAASKLALEDSGLKQCELSSGSPIVITGTSLMDSAVINKTIEDVATKGPRFGLARVVHHGPTASIGAAIAEVVKGSKSIAFQSACCSGLDAIGYAASLVAEGQSDIAVCGGTEAPIYYHPMLELKMAELSPSTAERAEDLCRPFDLWRTTGVIGEGACMLVIEPEHSPRLGYAFVDGYASAYDQNQDAVSGLEVAIRLCLANGNFACTEVESLSAWGPGHRVIDAAEVRVLRRVFGPLLEDIPAVSIKGAIGNPFAAAGAIQAGVAALGLREGFIPPTVNWTYPDPDCRLNLSGLPRFLNIKNALINSHGIAGTNACLLLSKA